MISLIEALNYRCLRYVHQPLGPFHVLVGPNASGKTTFLDTIAFLGRLVSDGLEAALHERSANFEDLLTSRTGDRFELAIEARIPEPLRADWDREMCARYEVAVGRDLDGAIAILAETVRLTPASVATRGPESRVSFPRTEIAPPTIQTGINSGTIIHRFDDGFDCFYPERMDRVEMRLFPFKLGPRKSALGNLPDDESTFPVATWLKQLLSTGVQKFILDSLAMRKASPPGQIRGFKTDGSNLPWVVGGLKTFHPDRFENWISHVRTALPDVRDIRIVERADDKHRYLVLIYEGGLEVPSWMVSDGTLRLLALTLPAYLPGFSGVYLIEEPENGIHPRAVETVFQSLSSVYNAQILVATHSPVILSIVEPEQVLCFAKTTDGVTDIVLGSEHPALSDWKNETNLGILFAAGVLG